MSDEGKGGSFMSSGILYRHSDPRPGKNSLQRCLLPFWMLSLRRAFVEMALGDCLNYSARRQRVWWCAGTRMRGRFCVDMGPIQHMLSRSIYCIVEIEIAYVDSPVG
eukprot:scaffold3181_cov167-Amphora_coffeaeformis.AAC.15